LYSKFRFCQAAERLFGYVHLKPHLSPLLLFFTSQVPIDVYVLQNSVASEQSSVVLSIILGTSRWPVSYLIHQASHVCEYYPNICVLLFVVILSYFARMFLNTIFSSFAILKRDYLIFCPFESWLYCYSLLLCIDVKYKL